MELKKDNTLPQDHSNGHPSGSQTEELQALIEEKDAQLRRLQEELAHYKLHYGTAIEQRDALRDQLAQANDLYNGVIGSVSWRVTKPLRFVRRGLGAGRLRRLLKEKIPRRLTVMRASVRLALFRRHDYQAVRYRHYTEAELRAQKTEKFPKEIKFSILVPLYNTAPKYLREMIRSVQDQTYGNWELCLADGSDAAHEKVGRIAKKYAKKDKRIRYRKLEKNLGISGNTNACIDMAEGDYISLFDHDDLLHPAALYATMKAVCEQDAQLIYTDEDVFYHTPADAFFPHLKPDYAPDSLRSNNYICHFTSFHKSLLDSAGRFRPECDGSQDYDMILRLTEKTEKIVHIPQVLYFWRSHPKSVADSLDAKPYVIDAAKQALSDHLRRVGLKGEVLESAVPSIYRVRYEIQGEPLVSIIIPNCEDSGELKTCLDSIYEKSTYRNFEVIVVGNGISAGEYGSRPNLKVLACEGACSASAVNAFGAAHASGEHLLLLNSGAEVISPDWIQELLMFSQRSDVGAVGAKLYYRNNTVRHAGLGLNPLAEYLYRDFGRSDPGHRGFLAYAQNLSGVSTSCVMLRRQVWEQIGGMGEAFEGTFNDLDMCMRIRGAGYRIVWTPFAELYHGEPGDRWPEDTPEKRQRFLQDAEAFRARWAPELADGDPYYNPGYIRV